MFRRASRRFFSELNKTKAFSIERRKRGGKKCFLLCPFCMITYGLDRWCFYWFGFFFGVFRQVTWEKYLIDSSTIFVTISEEFDERTEWNYWFLRGQWSSNLCGFLACVNEMRENHLKPSGKLGNFKSDQKLYCCFGEHLKFHSDSPGILSSQ